MSAERAAVTAIVPAGIDDPRRPSGGNRYDRAVLDALRAAGWRVREALAAGIWPRPDQGARQKLARLLAAGPPGEPVLVDGLIASAAADLVTEAARRRRIVVLVHLPLGPSHPELAAAEARMLRAVASVVATSDWTRDWLISHAGVPAGSVRVATPGVDPVTRARRSTTGGRLLCVAAVTRAKGYDVLLAALAELADYHPAAPEDGSGDAFAPAVEPGWRCWCVGSLEVEPAFARQMLAGATELGGQVRFTGPLTGEALAARYAAADLLVLPSRSETWGLVITEALARGIPVIAGDVGGVPQALGWAGGDRRHGRAGDGRRPGLLVPAGDPPALAGALRRWLDDPALRRELRAAAELRRTGLPGWDTTAAGLALALYGQCPPADACSVSARPRRNVAGVGAGPTAGTEGRPSLSR